MKTCGVYAITNRLDNKCYVGSSKNIEKRWNKHKQDLLEGRHHSIILQRAYFKYGIEEFKFTVIEECGVENLITREQHYIDTLNPAYNICKLDSSCEGISRSDTTRQKMSESKKHRIVSQETRDKLSSYRKGRKASEETKKKMSEARLGVSRPHPMTLSNKESLLKANLGRKLSKESLEKMSESIKKTLSTPEVKKKMRDAWKCRKEHTHN